MRVALKLPAIAAALLIPFVFACKKSKDEAYIATITLNGTTVTLYDATCKLGPTPGSPGTTTFRMTAATYDSSQAFTIDIAVNGINIPTGTYASDASNALVEVNYYEDINVVGFKNYTIADASGKPASKFIVNLSQVGGGIIRGSFTGNYLTNVAQGNTTCNLTQGEFVALRVY